jgi:glycine dehydrogenase subunit 1
VDTLLKACVEERFLAGVKINDHTLMLAVTEQRTKEEIDELVDTIRQIMEEMP